MPNVISRIARYFLRNRKRSASMQSPPTASNQSTLASNNPSSNAQVEYHGAIIPDEKVEAHRSEDITKEVEDVKVKENSPTNDDSEGSSESKMQTVVIKMSNEIQQSSTVRNRRVLRELRSITKAMEDPNCSFQVSLVDESNIFEWDIKLIKVDETSDLWRSMQQTNTESINFRLTFPELFPFQPPFLRLVGPYLDNGFIMDGGAICMEVLTSQGWSSAYTVESLLVQVASGLTQGGAIVSRRQKRRYNKLTQRRAEVEFRRICKIHAKYGWVSMDRDDL